MKYRDAVFFRAEGWNVFEDGISGLRAPGGLGFRVAVQGQGGWW